MVMEFKLPGNEGPYSRGPTRLKIYSQAESPDFGSLEKEAFDFLSAWTFGVDPQGYALGSRIGVKNRFVDLEGETSRLVLNFPAILSPKGRPMPPEVLREKEDHLRRMGQMLAVRLVQETGENYSYAQVCPPQWMQDELITRFGQ